MCDPYSARTDLLQPSGHENPQELPPPFSCGLLRGSGSRQVLSLSGLNRGPPQLCVFAKPLVWLVHETHDESERVESRKQHAEYSQYSVLRPFPSTAANLTPFTGLPWACGIDLKLPLDGDAPLQQQLGLTEVPFPCCTPSFCNGFLHVGGPLRQLSAHVPYPLPSRLSSHSLLHHSLHKQRNGSGHSRPSQASVRWSSQFGRPPARSWNSTVGNQDSILN